MTCKSLALFLVCPLTAVAAAGVRTFSIDAAKTGAALPNPSQMLTSWNIPEPVAPGKLANLEWDVRDFAEWVEIMAATGGNAARDGFREPNNRAVRDDYDFSKLVAGCRGVLALGMKPYLKLGNVPMKLSSNISNGDFRMNIRPPDDNAEYARYMAACARALLKAFGKDELLTWRYAVLTEYENPGWFLDATGDAERTFQQFCLLYETTVTTFARVISPNLTFGVHSMTVSEGLWDERRFFAFAAVRKLPLTFVTASFYDRRAGVPTRGLPLPKTLAHLRTAAEKAGLKGLRYGVDEGRLLHGTPGKVGRDLVLRIVGDTYEAAYDARIVRELFDSGAEYFSAWGYFTGPHTWFDGAPAVSFHVAREAAKFKGLRRLAVTAAGGELPGLDCSAVAALAPDGRRLQIMAYAFTNAVGAAGSVPVRLSVRLPAAWCGKTATWTQRLVDDRVNWFPAWRKDRQALGLSNDRFGWSPDDPSILSGLGLLDPRDREKVEKTLLPRYCAQARLKPVSEAVPVGDDLSFVREIELPFHGVLFLEGTL